MQLRPLPDIFTSTGLDDADNGEIELTNIVLSRQCYPNVQLSRHTQKMVISVWHKGKQTGVHMVQVTRGAEVPPGCSKG